MINTNEQNKLTILLCSTLRLLLYARYYLAPPQLLWRAPRHCGHKILNLVFLNHHQRVLVRETYKTGMNRFVFRSVDNELPGDSFYFGDLTGDQEAVV